MPAQPSQPIVAPLPQFQVFGRSACDVARGMMWLASSTAAIRLVFFMYIFECLLEMLWMIGHLSFFAEQSLGREPPMVMVMLLTLLRLSLIFSVSGWLRLAVVMLATLALASTYLWRLQSVWHAEDQSWVLALESLGAFFALCNALVFVFSCFTLAGLLCRDPYTEDPLVETPPLANRARVLRTFSVAARGPEVLHTCTVCLAEMEPGDTVSELGCGHCFHADCIDQWLRLGKRCPMRCKVCNPDLLLNEIVEALAEAFPPGRPCPLPRRQPHRPHRAPEPAPDAEAARAPDAQEVPDGASEASRVSGLAGDMTVQI